MNKALKKHPLDNVATVLQLVKKGEVITVLSDKNTIVAQIRAVEQVPFGNKIALCQIENDKSIVKSGYSIGRATSSIHMGGLVHVHNLKSGKINFPDSIVSEILRQMEIE